MLLSVIVKEAMVISVEIANPGSTDNLDRHFNEVMRMVLRFEWAHERMGNWGNGSLVCTLLFTKTTQTYG